MIELSIISGNDFTSTHVRGHLRGKVGFKGRLPIKDVASWIKQHRKVENHAAVAREIVTTIMLYDHLQYSRKPLWNVGHFYQNVISSH